MRPDCYVRATCFAAPITYDVDGGPWGINGGTVVGTIETDGTIGTLGASNYHLEPVVVRWSWRFIHDHSWKLQRHYERNRDNGNVELAAIQLRLAHECRFVRHDWIAVPEPLADHDRSRSGALRFLAFSCRARTHWGASMRKGLAAGLLIAAVVVRDVADLHIRAMTIPPPGARRPKGRRPVLFEPTSTGYSAHVPDLPACVAAAATLEEARELIKEAIEFPLEGMRSHSDVSLLDPESDLRATAPNCAKLFNGFVISNLSGRLQYCPLLQAGCGLMGSHEGFEYWTGG